MSRDKPTILCVENRRDLLDEMSRMLADAGYDVLATTSGESALELVHSGPVDGVLIDLLVRDPVANTLRDEIRRTLPAVPILLFHGDKTLLTLHLNVLTAWIRRARREVGKAGEDPFAVALEEYGAVGKARRAGPAL